MDFGAALHELKCGRKVAREGWNGKGMFIFMVEGNAVQAAHGSPYARHGVTVLDGQVIINPAIHMLTASGEVQPGWLASQTDMFAEDWLDVG